MADPLAAWARALAAWAIPDALLSRATDNPWSAGAAPYRERAQAAAAIGRLPDAGDDVSRTVALDALAALPGGAGSVLDVGAGAGAAGLALARRATRLTGVDRNAPLLAELATRARAIGLDARLVEGPWPEAASGVPAHDVVVSHHVLYDVADIGPFIRAIAERAHARVVLEISREHPLAWTNPLWRRFHGIARPERPTLDDALAALGCLGIEPQVRRWERPRAADTLATAADRARRNLCLPPDREPEVAAAIEELAAGGRLPGAPLAETRPVATIWWDAP